MILIQGLDLPDVRIAVQWKAPKSICAMVQRLGQAVRNKSLRGRGIVISEAKWFDEEIAKQKASEARKNHSGVTDQTQ